MAIPEFRPKTRAGILALLAGISCGRLVDPPLPADARLFVPPPVYSRWWAMVEECSGLRGSLDKVQWYSAPEELSNPDNSGDRVEGYWSRASNRIVLSRNRTIDGAVVRHEMLHALVRSGGHSRRRFLQECGGVVSCPPSCIRDAGAPLPWGPATPTVDPSQLEVTSAVSPRSPSSMIDGGLATFTISVRNPFAYPVVVQLPNSSGGGVATSYRYAIRQIPGGGLSSANLAFDIGVTHFAPGETKRDVFDFVVVSIPAPSYGAISGIGSGITLPPGSYLFRGDYGGHSATDLSVQLNP
jgi:hypothetical protein